MKTADFINALAAEPIAPQVHLGRRVVLALALGAAVSASLFAVMLGPRPDVAAAMHTMRFDLKFVDALAMLAPCALLALRLLRPDARPGALIAMFVAPFALLAVAVAVELAVTPSDLWMVRLIGSNAVHCTTLIPLMAIPPLAALIFVDARRRAALSDVDRRARRRGGGKRCGPNLRHQLPRQLAAVRRDLVSAGDADRLSRRRAGRAHLAAVVSA